MTDNFQLIKEFIQSQWGGHFNDFKDAFYTIEIIGRRKDDATIEARKFKTYFIKDIEDLDKYESEIKAICDTLQMRAYISINNKSWRKVTLNTMAEYAYRIAHDDFSKPYSIFESCAGKFVDRSAQLWIIDVDKEDAEYYSLNAPMTVDDLVDSYIKIVESCEPKKKIVAVIPTKSGKHIITHPFNIIEFGARAPHNKPIDAFVKKNSPTLLYENVKHS